MELVRPNHFDNDVIFIDGFSSSGKCLISWILQHYKGVELQREDEIFTFVSQFSKYNLIDYNTAVAMMRMFSDRLIYNLTISRDINFRLSDNSCLFKYPYFLDYINRVFKKDRYIAKNSIDTKKPILQIISHDVLNNIDLHVDSFGDRLKVIYMVRNPINIIEGIEKGGFGYRIGTEPTNMISTFKHNDTIIPLYAYTWKDDYIEMNPIDRIVRWVYENFKESMVNFNRIKENDNIKFIIFEDLVTNPYPICDELSGFIGREYNFKLHRLLRKENCFRTIKKENNLYNRISDGSKDLIEELLSLYEKNGWLR